MATLDLSLSGGSSAETVNWKERINAPRSPQYVFETDRSSCTRIIDVAWNDYHTFAKAALGYTVGPDLTRQCLSRKAPWGAPVYRSDYESFLYASKVSVEGLGVDAAQGVIAGSDDYAEAIYKIARCTVEFTTRTHEIMTDDAHSSACGGAADESLFKRYVTKVVRPSGEFLSLGDGTAFYCNLRTGTAPSQVPVSIARGINKALLYFNLSLTWHLVPYDCIPSKFYNPNQPNDAIDTCLGRVNNDTFCGMPKGTMLLMAVEIRPLITPFGDRVADLTYMFKQFNNEVGTLDVCNNPKGHNHFFRPKKDALDRGWYEGTYDGPTAIAPAPNCTNFVAMTDGVSIYDWGSFPNLFRPCQHNPGSSAP